VKTDPLHKFNSLALHKFGKYENNLTKTCFEHHVLIIRRSKFYYRASGIVTHVGGRPVHRFREDCAQDGHLHSVMTLEAL